MAQLGDLFPGRKLLDESGEDADGELVGKRWDVDLDGGVVRLRRPAEADEELGPAAE
jgi:hypothetical protein